MRGKTLKKSTEIISKPLTIAIDKEIEGEEEDGVGSLGTSAEAGAGELQSLLK